MTPYFEPATEAQIRSIESFYNSTIDFQMTANQAGALLSVRDYVKAVAAIVRDEGLRVSGDHMRIVAAWIVNEPIVKAEIVQWNARRFKRGSANGTPRLRRNSDLFVIVYAKMKTVVF